MKVHETTRADLGKHGATIDGVKIGFGVIASEIRVGDTIIVNPQVTVHVDEISKITAKQITVDATYLKCEFSPGRVGQRWPITYRLETQVRIAGTA